VEVFLIFSKKSYLKTTFKKHEIKNIIFSIITPLNKTYDGKIYKIDEGKYDFEIWRKLTYGNAFNPIIKGKIFENTHWSIIKLNIGMHPFVRIFLSIWFSSVIIIGLPLSLMLLVVKNIYFLIPIIMLIFGKILIQFGYKNEYMKSKEHLRNLLNA
jgi:hypothetical protein